MTVNGSSLMAAQMYANKNVQAQSGASGYATQGAGSDLKSGSIDKAEFSQAAQALAKNTNYRSEIEASASDATLQTNQTNSSTQASSTSNELQKSLFNKIMAAYSNTTTTTGMTTNISA